MGLSAFHVLKTSSASRNDVQARSMSDEACEADSDGFP